MSKENKIIAKTEKESSPMLPVSMTTVVHVTMELIIMGGLTFLFNKKITTLTDKIKELEKKIENSNGGGDKESIERFSSQMQQFQQQTSQHINNLYSIVRQLRPLGGKPLQETSSFPTGAPMSQRIIVQQESISLVPPPQEKESKIEVIQEDGCKDGVCPLNVSQNETIKEESEEETINEESLDKELEEEMKELENNDEPIPEGSTSLEFVAPTKAKGKKNKGVKK